MGTHPAYPKQSTICIPTRERGNEDVNTDGFKKTRVTLHAGAPGSGTVSAYVQRLNTPGPKVYEQTSKGETLVEKSNVDLTEELPALKLNRRYFEANIKAIQAQDKILGSLLDIV